MLFLQCWPAFFSSLPWLVTSQQVPATTMPQWKNRQLSVSFWGSGATSNDRNRTVGQLVQYGMHNMHTGHHVIAHSFRHLHVCHHSCHRNGVSFVRAPRILGCPTNHVNGTSLWLGNRLHTISHHCCKNTSHSINGVLINANSLVSENNSIRRYIYHKFLWKIGANWFTILVQP